MQNTSIVQGSFTSAGNPVIINIPMSCNWIRTLNYTKAYGSSGTPTASDGVMYEWFQGMPQNSAFQWKTISTTGTQLNVILSGGFTQISNPNITNDQINNLGTPIVVASTDLAIAQSSGDPAVATVTTASLSPLVGYSIVRLVNTANMTAINGVDFSFDTLNVGAGTFNFTNTAISGYSSFVDASDACTIYPVGMGYWYPSTRKVFYIVSNGNGTSTVQTTVTAPYQYGQTVRFQVPNPLQTNWGISQAMNGVTANVIGFVQGVASTSSPAFIIDIDIAALGYGTFLPLGSSGAPALTQAGVQWIEVTPIGALSFQENTYVSGAYSTNPIPTNAFNWSEFNQGYNGMQLASGTTSPAGSNGDVIYWIAGLSYNVYLNGSSIVPNVSALTIPQNGILPPLGQ